MTVYQTQTWTYRGICTSLPAQQTGQKQDMYYTVKVSHKQVRRTVLNGFTRHTKQSSSLQALVWLSRGQLVRTSLCKSGKSRSEEHTSELQSRFDLVCRLLL